MNRWTDAELDALLGDHLHAALDGQCGRAGGAFERYRQRGRTLRLVFTTAAAAVITVAALVAWDRLSTSSPVSPPQHIASLPAPAAPLAVEPVIHSAAWSRFVDDGLRMVDDQPVRQLRRNYVEQVEWYDPQDGATVRTTVPRQQIILIGVRTD